MTARAGVVRIAVGSFGAARLLRLAAAGVSGVAIAAAFPPHGWCGFAWVALVPLWVALAGVAPRQAFGLGWLTGTVAQAGLLSWVVPTLRNFSALPLPVVGLVFALLALAAGLPMGLFAAGLRATARRGWGGPVVGAAWFVVAEWLGTWVPVRNAWASSAPPSRARSPWRRRPRWWASSGCRRYW
jgi:apolipoprotein N-acyltransferase